MKETHPFLERLMQDEGGQAMAEYAIVVAVITTTVIGAGAAFLPNFIRALQQYYDSYYIMLNLPIP